MIAGRVTQQHQPTPERFVQPCIASVGKFRSLKQALAHMMHPHVTLEPMSRWICHCIRCRSCAGM